MSTLLEVCTGGPAASGTVEDEEEEKVEKGGIFFKVLNWIGRLGPVGLGRGQLPQQLYVPASPMYFSNNGSHGLDSLRTEFSPCEISKNF